jgi:HEAT repeat protein
MNLAAVPESKQMDVIEADIVTGGDEEEAYRRLASLLEGENPWVRARAAKILYRLNPKLSLEELQRLVTDASNGNQVPGMWALAELATEEALDLLAPLAYSPNRDIQQGAIRSLLQLQTKENLPAEARRKVLRHLDEIRSKTGLVF